MEGVSFDTDNQQPLAQTAQKQSSFTSYLIEKGWASSEKEAEYILLSTVVLCAIIAVCTVVFLSPGDGTMSPAEIREYRAKVQRGEVPFMP
jgi:hypothetical protein